DDRLPAPRIELEQLRARPGFRALVRDEDRHVADDAHAALVGIGAQGEPLAEEAPLAELPEDDARSVRAGGGRERPGSAPCERLVPLAPGAAAVVLVERAEQRVIAQPSGVTGAEGGEVGALLGAGPLAECARGAREALHAPRRHRGEVDAMLGARGRR